MKDTPAEHTIGVNTAIARDTLMITGEHLTMEDVAAGATGAKVCLAPHAVEAMARSWQAVQTLLERGEIAYGITTGFGAFKGRLIPQHEVAALQRNLVLSHAAAWGSRWTYPPCGQ